MARTGTPFGGLAGEMLARTTFISAIVTGVIFLVAVGTLVILSARAGNDLALLVAAQLLVSFFLAHFAMEGYSDKWEKAGRPIPLAQVSTVAMRYTALAVIVLAPLFVFARSRDAALALMMAPQASAVVALIYALIVAASPPVLLVVAVSASSWSELVSPGHWSSRFRARWNDLFLIYVIFVGAIFCVALIGLPIVVFARTQGINPMRAASAAVFLFAAGFALSLLGRLCGSFAAGWQSATVDVKPAVLHPSLSPFQGADKPSTAAAVPPRRTVLLDAGPRVEQLRATHGADATALAAALRELDEAFLPHPAVRQALSLALVGAGRQQEAVAVARDAIPLCIASGSVSAAALIYEALLASGDTFGLTKDQIVALGDALKSMKHYAGAVEVYAGVLRSHIGDVKSMKGMIAVAQILSRQKETAVEAVRIYDDLVNRCPGSPLLDFVNAERAKAQRKA